MMEFPKTSYFIHPEQQMLELPEHEAALDVPQKLLKLFEDWSHRLQSCADEAGDADLLALESDLLDLRDEIVFELHSRL